MSEFTKIMIGAAGGAVITGFFALLTLFINRGLDDAQIGTGYASGVCVEFDCYMKAT